MESIPLALAYDDVLLVPQFSSIKSRRHVRCTTQFTRQIRLHAPFVSANMDTVTEAPMARVMAEFGGIGVIHRFMSVQAQADEVAKVKRYQGNIIENPHTIAPHATIGEARQLMEKVAVNGLPVVDGDGRLMGIITRRDIQLAEDMKLVSERMTPRERLLVGPANITLDQARAMLSERRLEKLPLEDGEGRLAGLITAKDLAREGEFTLATRDSKGRLRVGGAIGVIGDYLERAQVLAEAGADALVIDIAHGDSQLMLSAVRQVRERLGATPLVAGNVATAEGVERLVGAGVDALKIGVGPGSMCITRQVAGVGVPQFTAVLEGASVAHKYSIPLIADGGIRSSGDVVKAIGAGASTVMLGNLLAGTDESPGILTMRDGRRVKLARGMASAEAAADRALREDLARGWARWALAETDVAPEGVQRPVPYRGPAKDVLAHLLAGLRSGMSYCNAETIAQMWQNARFVRQTEAGRREGGSHNDSSQ